ncbi:hypothetical protein L1887_51606 [Cichorium endivia]|nr:hypothetical protein L1887_51606 [Cichorium endivia]
MIPLLDDRLCYRSTCRPCDRAIPLPHQDKAARWHLLIALEVVLCRLEAALLELLPVLFSGVCPGLVDLCSVREDSDLANDEPGGQDAERHCAVLRPATASRRKLLAYQEVVVFVLEIEAHLQEDVDGEADAVAGGSPVEGWLGRSVVVLVQNVDGPGPPAGLERVNDDERRLGALVDSEPSRVEEEAEDVVGNAGGDGREERSEGARPDAEVTDSVGSDKCFGPGRLPDDGQ